MRTLCRAVMGLLALGAMLMPSPMASGMPEEEPDWTHLHLGGGGLWDWDPEDPSWVKIECFVTASAYTGKTFLTEIPNEDRPIGVRLALLDKEGHEILVLEEEESLDDFDGHVTDAFKGALPAQLFTPNMRIEARAYWVDEPPPGAIDLEHVIELRRIVPPHYEFGFFEPKLHL